MSKTQQNFDFVAGDSATLEIPVVDSAGAAVNLTGSTIIWALYLGRTTPVEKTTTTGGVTITGAGNDTIQVVLQAADTEGLSPGEYLHAAKVTDAAGKENTVTEGTVTIRTTALSRR